MGHEGGKMRMKSQEVSFEYAGECVSTGNLWISFLKINIFQFSNLLYNNL